MFTLHALRRTRWLTRWVTLVFVLALQVAALAPVVAWAQSPAAQAGLGPICSAANASGNPSDPQQSNPHHTLQCALCLPAMALPLPEQTWQAPALLPAAPLARAAVSVAQRSVPQPAARGPPLNA
ncbi:DUF2946 family protein [Curvibacter sp. CHRR-16]|uniref:DUF2946 family protein n=1 Tax=Curvibacter sp. CHRR-16 TaxID=2835872 RepID=UPI001BDA8225|nr:DUF2946 family protein [Curvibacter sp. CHRR-16]MBT0569829.1 DUF2946 family protein [Curvibacter sp. CHRR-16]